MKNKESTELLNQLLRGEFPDENGRCGPFGGQFAPETLMPALKKLEKGVKQFLNDDSFRDELTQELQQWAGRPTGLTFAGTLSAAWGANV